MDRLGLTTAWDDARRRVESADGEREIEFFAVDVADGADARVKIYYRNHGADVAELNRVAAAAVRHDAESAHRLPDVGRMARKAPHEAALSCLAFRPGLDRAAEATTYLRLPSLAMRRRRSRGPHGRAAARRRRRPRPVPRARRRAGPRAARGEPRPARAGQPPRRGWRGDITTYFRFPVYDQTLATVELG